MPGLKFYLRNPLTPPRIEPDTWRTRAACAGHPTLPAWVWDDKAGSDDDREDPGSRSRRIAKARAVCAFCPVRWECLAEVDLTLDDGVRGGVDLRSLRQQHGQDGAA